MVFSGTVNSDYLKLVSTELVRKTDLIDYTSIDFISFREKLINYIKAVYPLDYQNFAETDLGVMLIECLSYIGAVLGLKADMLANESFLRTSRNRNNVKKLLELIGVRMKGPISAAANAQATLTSEVLWQSETDLVTIPAASRVINITSPEDGASLSYTLYKVVNGDVQPAINSNDITLYLTEADNYADTGLGFQGSIFSNLVLLEGALVVEQGTFTNTESVKTIPLTQFPVVEGSVSVYVNGTSPTSGAYTQVDNVFFASGESDRVFQIVSNDDYAATVVFGDNNLGVSPNSGDSFVVTYRVGGGTRGNIANKTINTSIAVTTTVNPGPGPQDNSMTLQNTSQGTGGADAETVEHAKRYAPLTFRRQDRLVTLPDFKSFANSYISSYGSIGKATAVVRRAFSSANIIDLYVLEKANNLQLRKATPAYKQSLLEEINRKKMLTDEIVISDGLIRTLDLAVTVVIDKELASMEESIKLKVNNKILEFMSVDNNDFGKTLILADLNKFLFSVPEIRYTKIDNLTSDVYVDFNEIIQLNNLSLSISRI